MTSTLTYQQLSDAVRSTGVGLRSRIQLEPLGGAGDKIFPASYAVADNALTKYAMEDRTDGDRTTKAVVLDSVAAQANRMELALLDAIRSGELRLPVVEIDFAASGLAEYSGLSTFEVPHRIYDAIMRDSILDGSLFRLSDIGRSVTEASPRNAAALFRYSPHALLFGAWDSTGPRGGRGSKFERAITSEIVGLDATLGVKTASRLDPLGIEKSAGPLFKAADGDWTLDKDSSEKGELFSRKSGEGKAGDPSHANHGNVAPSIETKSGGVTVGRIVQTVVLSFVALRRLQFPTDSNGQILSGTSRSAAELSARTAIAAMGVAATVLSFEAGHDLRSRCVLAPSSPLEFELIERGRSTGELFEIDRAAAIDLVHQASERATAAGLSWLTEPLVLSPAPNLVALVKKSKNLAADE